MPDVFKMRIETRDSFSTMLEARSRSVFTKLEAETASRCFKCQCVV